MKNIKALFIDWNKTLSYDHFWQQLQNENHELHHLLAPIEKSLFIKNKSLINPWMRGEYSAEEICEIISLDTGIDAEIIFEELKRSCENMSICIPEITEIIKTIQKRGIKVIIATDNMDVFQRFTVPSLQLDNMFDAVLNSATLGILKEDVTQMSVPFFDSYLKEQKLTYDDIILLDDSEDKTNVYHQVGFKRIKIASDVHLRETLELFI